MKTPVKCILLVGSLLSSLFSLAAEPQGDENKTELFIQETHDSISGRVARYATEMDIFISSIHTEKPVPGSWIKIRPKMEWEDGSGFGWGATFSARIALSRTREKWALITDNIAHSRLPNQEPAAGENDDLRTGLRWDLLQRAFSWVSWDAGLRFTPWAAPYIRLTGAHTFKFQKFSLELTEQLFYYNQDDGFGELTKAEITAPMGQRDMLRMVSAATWSEETNGLEWEQSGVWGRLLRPGKCELWTRASMFGHKNSEGVVDNYILNVTWRRKLRWDWCIVNITPQIGFPRERDFKLTPKITIALEVYFGESSDSTRMGMDDM